MEKGFRLIKCCVFIISALFFVSVAQASQGKCYVVVESTGSYDNLTISSIATSLLRKYVDPNIRAVPLTGFSEKECHYRINVTEKTGSLKAFVFGDAVSDYGTSELRAEKGLEQAILKAVFKGIEDSAKRQKICFDHKALLLIECRDIAKSQDRLSNKSNAVVNATNVRSTYNIGFTPCFMISWHNKKSTYYHRAGLVANHLKKIRTELGQQRDNITVKLIGAESGVEVFRDEMTINGQEIDDSDVFDDSGYDAISLTQRAKNLGFHAVVFYRLYRHPSQKAKKTLTTLLVDTESNRVFRTEDTTVDRKYLKDPFYKIAKTETHKVLDQYLAEQ